MNFKEAYTTKAIKAKVAADASVSAEDKAKEEKKTEVSDGEYLSAEMTLSLINKLEHTRLSMMSK